MIYLGIDGGGSKTTFLLVNDQLPISTVQTGPSNWLSVGPDAAAAAIQNGATQLTGPAPNVVCGGFAGAGRPEGLEFYRSVLQSIFPKSRILVESDAHVAYIGAIGLRPGVLLIAGTGSIAIGRKADGSMIRCGGWGPHFGDEGSGFWIGREAVRAALRSYDSQDGADFAARIAWKLGVKSIPDVVAKWATGPIGVPEIAGLFPELVAIYPSEPAAGILKSAAEHLRLLTQTAIQRVEIGDCPISASGSVATHPVMRQLIGLGFVEAARSPEWGAILLAMGAA